MKHCLLLLGIVAMLAVSAPAYSQYIFMDVNGDGICNTDDVVTEGVTTSVDIWLDTNHDINGTTVMCSDGVSPLDMFGYDVIVHAGGSGSVSFSGWTNAMATWTALEGFRTSGNDASVGFIAPGASAAPGKYKLGSFNFTATGTPVLSFLTTNASLGGGAPITGFGGACSGQDIAFTMVLGTDFFDVCGTSSGTPASPTTWGTIKSLYR
jgi:hypothetical protein